MSDPQKSSIMLRTMALKRADPSSSFRDCLKRAYAEAYQRSELIGQRVGRLVVQAYDPERGQWRCLCDCGKVTYVRTHALTSGATRSCGCLHRDESAQRGRQTPPRTDLTGRTFGLLTITGYDSGGHWRCVCTCGTRTIVRASHLLDGSITSCGCMQPEHSRKAVQVDNVWQRFDSTQITKLRINLGDTDTSGGHFRGVRAYTTSAGTRLFRVTLKLQGRSIALGSYRTYEQACAARIEGEKKYYTPIIEAWEASKKEEL